MPEHATGNSLADGTIDPGFDGLLEAIVRQEILPSEDRCQTLGWWCEDDVRPMLLVRYRALARATSVMWRAMKAEFMKSALGPPVFPVPQLTFGLTPVSAYGAAMSWGFLIGWYGHYEAGVRDLAEAVGVPLVKNGRRRWIVEIAADLADRVLPAARRAAFKEHIRLCQDIRNTSHNGGVHDPRGDAGETVYQGQTFKFEPGKPPRVPTQWHPFLRFSEAVRFWGDLIFSDVVAAIPTIASSNPIPPPWCVDL